MKNLPADLHGPKLLRFGDLIDLGMSRHDVREAVANKTLFRPVFGGDDVPGIYATAESVQEPDLDDALMGLIFDGNAIYHGQYAAMRHGLATSIPPTQILLPAETSAKPRRGAVVTRTRRAAALNEGIDEIKTSFGIPFKITSRARTVVDLLRIKERDGDDWRHGIDALHTYLDEGGDSTEIIRLSKLFETWVYPQIDAAVQSYSGGYRP